MKVTYIEKGEVFDFKRVDRVVTVNVFRCWRVGGLLYGYLDRFNITSIPIEDILNRDELGAVLE